MIFAFRGRPVIANKLFKKLRAKNHVSVQKEKKNVFIKRIHFLSS